MRKILFALLAFMPSAGHAFEGVIPHLSKDVIKKLYHGVYEIVVPKVEDDGIKYEKALPWDKLPFKERTDKFHSVGTAFAVAPDRFVSAAHVFHAEVYTLWRDYSLRDAEGKTYRIARFHRYSSYRDLVELELEKLPSEVTPITIGNPAEVGDDIFVVGNALGEGISFRGGQIASFTSEEVDGLWKFIRFSAPASPGNSGGPLIDSEGRVVGIVTRRNSTENYNFAVPVAELAKLSTKEAEFFQKDVQIRDGAITVSENFRASVKLPADFATLSSAAQKAYDAVYATLVDRLSSEGKGEVFPDSEKFRESLRAQSRGTWFGMVEKDASAQNWKIVHPSSRSIKIGDNRFVHQADGGGFGHFMVVEKDKGEKLSRFFSNPRKIMDGIIKAMGVTRSMGGESIRVLTYGEPAETREWTDSIGRVWVTSTWEERFSNMLIEATCSPVPKGAACIVDPGSASRKHLGWRRLREHNLAEVVLSYRGTVSEWEELLAMSPRLLPKPLQGARVALAEDGKLSLRFSGVKVEPSIPALDGESVLTLYVGYSPGDKLALEWLRFDVQPRAGRSEFFTLTSAYSPLESDAPDRRKIWEDLNRRSGQYSGRPYVSGSVNRVNIVLDAKGRAVAGAADKRYIAVCETETSDLDRDPGELCRKFAATVRLGE